MGKDESVPPCKDIAVRNRNKLHWVKTIFIEVMYVQHSYKRSVNLDT